MAGTISSGGMNACDSFSNNLVEGAAIVDADHVWTFTVGQQLNYTSDGGATWNSKQPPPDIGSCPSGMTFPDETHGWIVGAQGVDYTDDGANTWVRQDAGTHQSLNAVTFTDASHGWIVGDAGTIRYTDDGGATWMTIPSGTTNNLSAIAFSDPEHGWAVGDNGTILRITEAGA